MEICRNRGLPYEVLDCFSGPPIERLRDFDILLFHFGNYLRTDMHFARAVLYSAKAMGLSIFPDFEDAWHFDDKIAQFYLLQAVGAPIPAWSVSHSLPEARAQVAETSQWPSVGKLRTGSGSHNVRLLENRGEALRYARRMFGRGYDPSPRLLFKTVSNLRSSKTMEDVWARLQRAPEFFRTRRHAKEFDRERGYLFLQEFVPNPGYDIKVAVVGEKVSFFCRHVRKNDFRASGGADFFYDKDRVPEDVVRSALEMSRKLGLHCMGFDYVVDERTGTGVIVEMSYGFSYRAILGAGGYWDSDLNWHDEPLNVPEEILDALLAQRVDLKN